MTRVTQPSEQANSIVSSDTLALASHMGDCQRSRGSFYRWQGALQSMHAVASPRIVTTGALFVLAGLGLLLAVA